MDNGSNPSCPLCGEKLEVGNTYQDEITDYKCRSCYSKVDAQDLIITKRGIHPRIQKFIRESYHHYYSSIGIESPPRWSRREFAFITMSGFMVRHIAFKRSQDINEYILNNYPLHCYYSSAYYENPSQTPMKDKVEGWMGADLIFDLDADHLPGAEEMTFEQILDSIKGHAKRLIFEYLINDFGFQSRHIDLYFSGGRGYHIYVRNEDVWPLPAQSRRQISDYVQGRGIILDLVAPRKWLNKAVRASSEEAPRQFPIDHGGWTSKLQIAKRAIAKTLKDLDNDPLRNPMGDRLKFLMKIIRDGKLNIGYQKCRSLITEICESEIVLNKMIDTDFMFQFSREMYYNDFFSILIEYARINVGLETDAPVTTDTKRLIRLPGSLHGKTGMRVTRVDIEKMDEFNPLDHAIALNDDPIKIHSNNKFKIRMNGENIEIDEGTNTVPRYAAFFCIMKRGCEIYGQ